MSEDFIRYYIGYIALSTMKIVQQDSGRLDDWELLQGAKFDHKRSYGYKEIFKKDEILLEAIAKRTGAVIAETRQPQNVKPSVLWKNALSIADVFTLLSLARARYYSTLAIEKNIGETYNISWGLIPKDIAGSWDIVSISDFGKFISEALTFIENNPSWLEESGFIPGLYWYTQAQISYLTAPSILEMGLYWVSMETLANAYLDSIPLKIKYKKERVKRFILERGYSGSVWGFLDEVIDDWYSVRNDLFHEGKQNLSRKLLIKRRQQVRDFTSLVFVEMLQKQEDARKNEVATRMPNY